MKLHSCETHFTAFTIGGKVTAQQGFSVCLGLDSWNKPLQDIDSDSCQDVLRYMKSIEHFKRIVPLDWKLIRMGEQVKDVIIFHDASVSSIGGIIYLQIGDEAGNKKLRIVRSGTKCANQFVPVLEHISRS